MSDASSAPTTPPGKFRDVLALLFAMSFPTLLSWLSFMVLPSQGSGNNVWLQIVFGAGKVVQFTFPFIYVAVFERASLQIARPNSRGMMAGLGFGLVVALTTLGLYYFGLKGTRLFEATQPKIQHWLAQLSLPSAAGFLLIAGFICLLHSLWEEYYWRWFVFGRLSRRFGWQWSAVIAGLAFMAHHVVVLAYYLPGYFWVGVVPLSLCVAAGGVIWAWMYQRYQSLYATWVSHCLVDMGIMVVGYDLLYL